MKYAFKTLLNVSAISAFLFFNGCTSDGDLVETTPSIPQAAFPTPSLNSKNKFFIGQDLGAIRGYQTSECCISANGTTTYITLYNILSSEADFGGIGLNESGQPIHKETSWGSGPVSAFKSATEFRTQDLAIGLFIGENNHPGAMGDVLNGKYDAEIRQLAKLSNHVKGSIFLRIGYEFDGFWNEGHENTEVYKAVWRRIVDILRKEDTDNFIYVWQTSAAAVDDAVDKKTDDITEWYPGDSYVDWMAVSWFMNPDEKQSVESDYDTPTPRILLDELIEFARQKNKPVMIAEASPQGFDLDRKKERFHSHLWDGPAGKGIKDISSEDIWSYWYAPMFEYMDKNDDVIDALAYINVDWDSQPVWGSPWDSGYWGDTRIERDSLIAKNWNDAVSDWQNAGLK